MISKGMEQQNEALIQQGHELMKLAFKRGMNKGETKIAKQKICNEIEKAKSFLKDALVVLENLDIDVGYGEWL